MPVEFDANRINTLLVSYLQNKGTPDTPELEELLTMLSPFVAMVSSRFANAVDREDVVQEILIHLLDKLPRYNGNQSELRSWLSTIIRNKAISLHRHRKAHAEPPTIELEDDLAADRPEDTLDAHIDALATWIGVRFPSLGKDAGRALSRPLVEMIAHSRSAKAATLLIRRERRELPHVAALQVYESIIVFLRMISFDKPADTSRIDPEYSFAPEIRLLLGDRMFGVFFTLFKDLHIQLREKVALVQNS